VIGKVLRGTNARRLLYYLFGPGKANEHTDPHLVAGFGDPADLEPERRSGGTRDFRRLAGLLAQPLAALDVPGYAKPVWHCAVRAAPEDRMLSDAEWGQVAAAVMDRTGLASYGDDLGVRWVAVRHAADHIHLVATLARQDRTRPGVWNDSYRVREACRDAERQFGLRSTAPADRTAARRPTRAETEQASRRGWGETPRARLRREVCTAAAGTRTEQEFFTRLAQAEVLVCRRFSTACPGEVTGYAVGLPEHTSKTGQTIWYGGGKLAADLTLPKLRARWAGPDRDVLAGAAELPGPAVRAVLRNTVAQAAGRASNETEFFAELRASGVLVRERFSELNPGQVTGYAVTLPGCTTPDGTLRWYGGGRLADGLTLPRLRAAWNQGHGAAAGRSGAFGFTGAERAEIYRHAARRAAAAAEHLRWCTAHDPDRGADAAWAAADALHATARATGSPRLRYAAESYDRAARAPYGRIPRRTRGGEWLRATARLIAMAGRTSGDTTMLAAALMANLIALADAVAALRDAQAQAAQAAAARKAAEQLRAALNHARSAVPHFGQAHARSAQPADPAHADFPTPIAEVVRMSTAPGSGESHSRIRRPQPPTRARPRR
jgi:hypothetical protein